MADLHQSKLLSVEDAILFVLERYWDPLHLPNEVMRRGAYASFVAPVREALAGNPSAESLAAFLQAIKVKYFGVIAFPQTRERRAARKLLEIDLHLDGNNGKH
ncbi:MAG TPA: hypothetical protein VKY92_09325 [Verrucomicrobiae bacterium]|jgi:hypothetical protein|nr:hypothetical protein [Verrucomicrobiae bacterium]